MVTFETFSDYPKSAWWYGLLVILLRDDDRLKQVA